MTSENTPPDLSVSPTEPINLRFAALETDPPPVFVDSTGRRHRRLRWLAYGLGIACSAYLLIVGVSIAGGAATPGALLPFPEVVDRQEDDRAAPRDDEARPVGTAAANSDTSVGARLGDAITDAVPRAGVTARPSTPAQPRTTAPGAGPRTPAPVGPNPAPTTTSSSPVTPVDPPAPPTTAPTPPAPEPTEEEPPVDEPGTPPDGAP